ncbi:MAG: hypothetical protein ACKPCP_16370 [Sphaerospermopsis kisseleviana]
MFEVEVKALVPNPELLKAEIFKQFKSNGIPSEQLNHYFSYTPEVFSKFVNGYLPRSCIRNDCVFPDDISTAENVAVRTRWDSLTGTWLMLKYSITDDCSQNGIMRREFELNVKSDLSVLDNDLLEIGFDYQSKWSRNRVEYKIPNDISLFVDVNAGYRGICEVEKIVSTKNEILQAKSEVEVILSSLQLEELDGQLLKEMFNFYSANWQEFYGTSKSIFQDQRFQDILKLRG